MIKIEKGAEPHEWLEYRVQPDATYEDADAEAKNALRNSLLLEQGYICGYCMRRIDAAHSRIEHIKPQSSSLAEGHPEEALDYHNMILCCDGDINSAQEKKGFHCDRRKADIPIHFSPLESHVVETVSYSSKSGEIKSSDETYRNDFNDVLNLNHPRLKENRLATLNGVIDRLKKKSDWKKSELTDALNNYLCKNNEGKKKPYCGIVIWFLMKKIAQSK